MTLQVANVTGGYNQLPVLKNIDFTIGDGELVGLIGLNGAGKSTTIKEIIGLLQLTAGRSRSTTDLEGEPRAIPQTSGIFRNPIFI